MVDANPINEHEISYFCCRLWCVAERFISLFFFVFGPRISWRGLGCVIAVHCLGWSVPSLRSYRQEGFFFLEPPCSKRAECGCLFVYFFALPFFHSFFCPPLPVSLLIKAILSVCLSLYQGCRFSVIFRYFPFVPLFLARSVLRRSVSRMLIFSVFSYFIFLFLNFLSLFVFIFCETARTRRFSVSFAKVSWYPCYKI